ncbi:OmpA family protein, partial [candidate division GN15 bacterium]|nr:OmpA family protein [candidate division GN15 bacterium]
VDDVSALSVELDGRVAEMLAQNRELAQTVAAEKARLSQLSEQHEQVSAELEERREREAKVKKAKAIVNPSEGDVLFNASGDIVLRLHGLSFAVGKSDISEDQVPLLEKVEEIITMFPDSRLRIEGHTDATGNQSTNRQLSEKRAYSVMQYLRQSMSLPAERVTAVGYGSEKPVASNETADGRAKNRRIDIVIMQ